MKVYDLLKLMTESLKTMSRNGVFRDDYVYVEAYERFRRMRSLGVKYDNAINELSKEYRIAKRTLQRALKRQGLLNSDISCHLETTRKDCRVLCFCIPSVVGRPSRTADGARSIIPCKLQRIVA